MPEPIEAFFAHAAELQSKFATLRLSEADTRSYLIDPVLNLLGYVGVEHLRREVPVATTREFLDYELLVRGEPHAIVEAKALRLAISDQQAAQCVQYAAVLGVRWCFITNGVEWLLYDGHAKGPLADKRVAAVKLDGDERSLVHAWGVLSLFAREALDRSDPISSLLIERVLLDELKSPDSATVIALRRAVLNRFGERVSGAAIVAAAETLIDGATSSAPGTHAGPPASAPLPATPTPQQQRSPAASVERRVTIADLLSAGLLPEGAPIEARVEGVSHAARINLGQIELNGTAYSTPSAASMALRNGRAYNGWVDWYYKGETLDSIRKRLPTGPKANQISGA